MGMLLIKLIYTNALIIFLRKEFNTNNLVTCNKIKNFLLRTTYILISRHIIKPNLKLPNLLNLKKIQTAHLLKSIFNILKTNSITFISYNKIKRQLLSHSS